MSPFPHIVGLYIDELEAYLDETNKDLLCLFNTTIVIFLYIDDVVILS